jgi:excisionase family DNA binding protein
MQTRTHFDYSKFFTVGEVAVMLNVCVETIRNWDKRGRLKSYRHAISNYRLYKKTDIYKLLERKK